MYRGNPTANPNSGRAEISDAATSHRVFRESLRSEVMRGEFEGDDLRNNHRELGGYRGKIFSCLVRGNCSHPRDSPNAASLKTLSIEHFNSSVWRNRQLFHGFLGTHSVPFAVPFRRNRCTKRVNPAPSAPFGPQGT